MPLLEVEALVKEFSRKRGLLAPVSIVRAVDGVSFDVLPGEIGRASCRERVCLVV